MEAPSGLEEQLWQGHLDNTISTLLAHGQQRTLDSSLDYLFQHDVDAYDILVESVEQCSQSCTVTQDGQQHDVLLLAIPILAWTRFTIGSGILPEATVSAIKQAMQSHIVADGAHVALSAVLHAIEQLPQHHCDVFALLHTLAGIDTPRFAARPDSPQLNTIPFLADTRYLIATVTVPHRSAVFRWHSQSDPLAVQESKRACAQAWIDEVLPLLAPALPGCNLELMVPQAYFYNCREADKRIRPATILAAIHYLTHHLDAIANQLRVCIGKCSHDNNGEIDEYRIGFTLLGDNEQIYYGTVWPLYEAEDGDDNAPPLPFGEPVVHPLDTLRQLLLDCGISDITVHPEIFAAEFCDDCGSPLFPNHDGELVHAEMPEETPGRLEQLH